MIAKRLVIAFAVLAGSAFAATPASAGPGERGGFGLEFGNGRVVVRADYRRDGHGDHHWRRGGPEVHRHGRDCYWIESHYEIREDRIWVPGTVREEYVPPQYEVRIDCRGNRYQVLVSGGHYRRIEIPGHFEVRQVRIWVEGRWSCGC